jgi:exopolysaccharide biosynthesis polyprenyl glycosylphosphotransferase
VSTAAWTEDAAGWAFAPGVAPAVSRRRGWIVRRALLAADVAALLASFACVDAVFGGEGAPFSSVSKSVAFGAFLLVLPVWLVSAKLYGLYDKDEERASYSTVDELVGVFQFVSTALWLVCAASWLAGLASPHPRRLVVLWLLAVASVTAGRATARAICRRMPSYRQNTVIVGAGEIGQLIGRKLLQHPEYGINLIGFIDDRPKERRTDLGDLAILGDQADLVDIVRRHAVERVIVAFSNDSETSTLATVRALGSESVQVDLVPRLFEVIGPNVGLHSVEGVPLVALPPVRLSRSSRLLKRAIDVVGAGTLLVLLSPVLLLVALLVKLDSRGPVLFRQARLGQGMRSFDVLKFRTMRQDTDHEAHREYISRTMTHLAAVGPNGLYKLDRSDCITRVGRWLRKTSIDELPQLINVLRGDMSLVGPRPCIAYETELFDEHHFERFLMPAGMTGLWQVTARGKSTFAEAVEMDVTYVRSWSLGLDLRVLLRTPLELVRQGSAA